MLRQTLRGLLLLCGLPALFLLGLGGYVKLAQPDPPASAPLRVSVDRDILWPWQETRLRVEFNPARPVRPVAQPMDLVLILDTSGSLSDRHLALAKEAAVTFLRNIDAAAEGTRVGVVQFAGTAKLMSGLSADIPAIIETIEAMGREAGDGTQFLPALEQALSLLDKSSKAKVVLLTDGVAQEGPVSLRAFYEKDWKPRGHELFLLGVGADVDYDTLAQLTDDPSRFVVTRLDEAAPGAVFNEVARALGNFLGSDGRLQLPLSEPLVESVPADPDPGADPEVDPLPVRGPDQSRYPVSPLFARDYHWVLGLAPKLGGVLRVLHESPKLDYLDAEGRTNALVAADQAAPLVLAITPAMLFYLLLPALLYLLAQLLAWLLRPRGIIPDLAPIPRRRPLLQAPPPPLLRYPVEQGRRVDWSPGLVIGLGRSGRHVLTHLQQAIADTRDVPSGRPILLAVDVARDEVARPETVPGCLDPLVAEAVFLLPEGACKLQDRVHERMPADDPAAALDLGRFQNFGAELLSLRHGTNGDGALARLALLSDLRQGEQSALLGRLRTALGAWRQLRPDVPERQIMVVANVEGGLARGWLTDLLVFLRRLVAEDEERGQSVEIILLLLGSAEVHDPRYISLSPSQAGSIFDELDRLASAGRLPFRHVLAPPGIAEVLDGIVDRRPQDEVLVLGGLRDRWEIDLFPMAADSLLLLLDRHQRTDLTVALEALKQEENRCRAEEGVELYTEVKLHSAAIPRSVLVRLLGLRLQEILAQEILFPGLADSQGALRLPPLGENRPSFPPERGRGPTPTGLESLLTLATDGTGVATRAGEEEVVVSEADQDFVLYVQETWKAYLQGREWNLANLVQAARQAANNLRHYPNATTASLAQTLDHLADQALSWVALLLGRSVADAISGDVKHTASPEQGWLPKVIAEYTSTRQRLDEWQESPARVALDVVPRGTSGHPEDALLEHWLTLWLGASAGAETNPLEALAQRCRWELGTSGVEGARLGLSLAFLGTEAFRYPPTPAGLDAFRNTLHAHIDDSLGLLTETQVLSAVAKATAPPRKSPAEAIAVRLKGDLRGSRATLFVSMPGPDVSGGPQIDTLRRELQQAFEGQAGAAEIVRFHESRDPYRLHAWNLMPLKRAEPRRANAATPVHRYERARQDYARRLAQELGLTEVDLPAAAGLALSDPAKLKQFAGLWLTGKVWRDGSDGTYYLRVADEDRRPLTFFPQEGLAEAGARFVCGIYPAAAEGTGKPLIDCGDAEGMEPFAALLCRVWAGSQT